MQRRSRRGDKVGSFSLMELSHGILSYFELEQNYLLIEGNLKILLYSDRKTSDTY